ncbi:expressed unknown protein [Seminavis robusta]|uniref:Uncharacterized protein n=1 Tax=Seminavis robusta TaxID=568900 RepID=A0A9N8H005_9STRA|nr:expressed unknown protein [Seminavis robusta]|eukprot:Sro12_g009180.1 n/a (301) ;mRNA; r:32637-33639
MSTFYVSPVILKLVVSGLLLLLPGAGSQSLLVVDEDFQYDRNLAGFLLPFQISWRFEIFDGAGVPQDRQPTDAEYEGINEATENWFTVEIPAFYGTDKPFAFQEIECITDTTSYDDTAAEWQHQMIFQCTVTWEADSLDDVPMVETFLTDMNQPYLLDNFVQPNLRQANPQSPRNIFQFADRVGYTTQNTGTSGPAPAEGNTTAPTIATTTTAPTIATTTAPTTIATTAPTSIAALLPPMAAPTGAAANVPQKKDAPPAKCGSLSTNGYGGTASDANGCASRTEDDNNTRRRRKLKGSKY